MSGHAHAILHYWGGYPRLRDSKWWRFFRVVQRCTDRGWKTHLVWSRLPDDPSLSRPFSDCGCEIIVQPRLRRNFDLGCVLRTVKLLSRMRCDVIHCHNVHTSPLIGAALAGVPVRIWSKLAMSRHYEEGRRPRGLHRFAPSVRVSAALAHRVLPLSRAVRDELLDQGIAASKLMILPVPVAIERHCAASVDGVRREFGLTDSDLMITTVGHSVPVKGWDILLRAFSEVAKAMPKANLLLVGSMSEEDEVETARELRALVEELGIKDRARFLGQRSDVPLILAASDIFAFPSRSEGQGLALTEALAAGLACVATRAGGIEGLIEHGQNGLLFRRDGIKELSGHLLKLARDDALRERLGRDAARRAGRFDLDAYADRLVALYSSLASAK